MSSVASRRRQRQRRRARERLWAAQKDLAEREVDLVSYERVIVDMTTRRQLSPVSVVQAVSLVTICRDAAQRDCERLHGVVADRKQDVAALEPADPPSDPEEMLSS